MKFVMSYSCGKDSTLALHKMIYQGHQPLGLLVMVNEQEDRSFFHGADRSMLERYAQVLDIPLLPCPAAGERYHLAMEECLLRAKTQGAQAVCFGDIDIEGNRAWGEERCRNTGLEAVYPLWQRDRVENVYDLIRTGYKCLIKSIDKTLLPASLLGTILDEKALAVMETCGIDLCGENGEYHTLVMDGPIFKRPLPYETGRILDFGNRAVIEVM